MLNTLVSLYRVKGYVDDSRMLYRILQTLKMYSKFLYFYYEDPEIKLKYSRKLNMIDDDGKAIENIRKEIAQSGYEFDEITREKNKISFSLRDSKLSYVIKRDSVANEKMNLLVETDYSSFFPIRRIGRLKDVTGTFNKICAIVSSNYEIRDQKRIIFTEFVIDRRRKGKKNFEHNKGKITFDENGFQVSEAYTNNQADFLFYLSIRWLMDSVKNH